MFVVGFRQRPAGETLNVRRHGYNRGKRLLSVAGSGRMPVFPDFSRASLKAAAELDPNMASGVQAAGPTQDKEQK